MRTKTLLGFGVTAVASALTLQCAPAWADGPEGAYATAADGVPTGSLGPNEYQVNADGMKEDPNAKMSDVARAYRNGYINRGKQDQADYQAMIDSHNHGQRQPAKTDVARVDVPPLPAGGVPEDDNSKYTSIPPQPRQYAQRQVPQPPQPAQPLQAAPPPQYRQAYQEPQYAPAPMQYQQAPAYAQMQPQPVYGDSQPMYVQQEYAPRPPVQYVPVYAQPQYDEMPVVETVVQPVAPAVAYQVYRPPVYWGQPRMYAYRAPMVSYRVWR
jgi:hypothetical protein